MWKNFFGKKAKIIGVELNPLAKKFEKCGLNFIGDPVSLFFGKISSRKSARLSIILDDGGWPYYKLS